jgi:hypothetical protein
MRCSGSTFCVSTAESAVFCVSQSKYASSHRTRISNLWPKVIAATLTLAALALTTLIVSIQSQQTTLVARHVYINGADLQDLRDTNVQAGNAPSPAIYSELALIPASKLQDATLKSDFDSNLRLLKAAGGLDMSKVPQLGGSSEVVEFLVAAWSPSQIEVISGNCVRRCWAAGRLKRSFSIGCKRRQRRTWPRTQRRENPKATPPNRRPGARRQGRRRWSWMTPGRRSRRQPFAPRPRPSGAASPILGRARAAGR